MLLAARKGVKAELADPTCVAMSQNVPKCPALDVPFPPALPRPPQPPRDVPRSRGASTPGLRCSTIAHKPARSRPPCPSRRAPAFPASPCLRVPVGFRSGSLDRLASIPAVPFVPSAPVSPQHSVLSILPRCCICCIGSHSILPQALDSKGVAVPPPPPSHATLPASPPECCILPPGRPPRGRNCITCGVPCNCVATCRRIYPHECIILGRLPVEMLHRDTPDLFAKC
jgi:hypothetical protein